MEEQANDTGVAQAQSETAHPQTEAEHPSSRERRAYLIGIAGWILPGLGHALQFMWGRALVVFLAVGILTGAGAAMKGNVFTRDGNDAFDKLGYIADLGTGVFYVAAHSLEPGGADVSHAGGDYGTRLLATAGAP